MEFWRTSVHGERQQARVLHFDGWRPPIAFLQPLSLPPRIRLAVHYHRWAFDVSIVPTYDPITQGGRSYGDETRRVSPFSRISHGALFRPCGLQRLFRDRTHVRASSE